MLVEPVRIYLFIYPYIYASYSFNLLFIHSFIFHSFIDSSIYLVHSLFIYSFIFVFFFTAIPPYTTTTGINTAIYIFIYLFTYFRWKTTSRTLPPSPVTRRPTSSTLIRRSSYSSCCSITPCSLAPLSWQNGRKTLNFSSSLKRVSTEERTSLIIYGRIFLSLMYFRFLPILIRIVI